MADDLIDPDDISEIRILDRRNEKWIVESKVSKTHNQYDDEIGLELNSGYILEIYLGKS